LHNGARSWNSPVNPFAGSVAADAAQPAASNPEREPEGAAMSGTYCLTALEAAEMAGIELDELMALIAGDRRLAVQSGDSWRVDPNALHAALGRATFLKAA
jgi:hypothetical protein